MKSFTAALRTLVLPFGQTTGPRILLDGVNGRIFVYDSTGLINSIAPSAGTDPSGNHYLAGFTSFDNAKGTYTQILGSSLSLGAMVSGVPDTSEAGGLFVLTPVQAPGVVFLESGVWSAGGLTDHLFLSLAAGAPSSPTGSGGVPFAQLLDSAGTSAADFQLSGSVIRASNTGVPDQWVSATTTSGYTAVTLQYRRDAMDNLYIVGEVDQVTGVTGAGGATITTASAAAYHPRTAWRVPCAWLSSSSVAKGSAVITVNTNGTLSLFWPSTTASGDKFQFSVIVPLGDIS